MLSLPQGIYIFLGSVLGAVLGSIISGALLIINNSRNNNFQLERESQQRIWQEKSDKQKWNREKVYDSYRTAIHVLTKIIQLKTEITNYGSTPDKLTNLNNLYAEFSTEFYIMIISHPDKKREKFTEKTDLILDSLENKPTFARFEMIEIMENDPRIKDVNEESLNSEKSSTQSN